MCRRRSFVQSLHTIACSHTHNLHLFPLIGAFRILHTCLQNGVLLCDIFLTTNLQLISSLLSDHSVDYSSYSKPTYTANNRAPRPVTTNYDNDDDERSPEYKKIMGQTDVTLTMSKYAKKDEGSLKVDGMIEEERRSKAYSKIIGQSSAQQLVRSCL